MVLMDSFGRAVSQARLSLNSSNECNFRCDFCHKEGIEESNSNSLLPAEIEKIMGILHLFGVDRIKLTGGEPLLRRDIIDIVDRLKKIGMNEISLTTNGTGLTGMAEDLRKRGLTRVNISLHSLKRKKFFQITGADKLSETIKAIQASINAGLIPVKINTTLLRGYNEDEVNDLIDFSQNIGGGKTNVLQLIELVSNESTNYRNYHYPLNMIESKIRKSAMVTTERFSHRRPKYELSNGVTVEIVKPMHNTGFCGGCNRLRITYDGRFKPCLLKKDNYIDFLTPMRSGASDSDLIELFKLAISLREPFFKLEKQRLPNNSFPKSYKRINT
jgi:cyclic pyranopterin phosphate synthase